MSKKNRQKQKWAHKQQQQKAQRPAARLQLAEEAFQTGDFEKAVAAAELALRAAGDPPTQQRARTLLASATLHQLHGKQPQAQLPLLTHVLAQAPNDGRLHYQHGLTLARLGRFADAAAAFQATAERQPNRPGLPYLQQLVALAAGKPMDDKALTEPQRATVNLLQQLDKTKSGEKSWKNGAAGLPTATIELWSVLLQMFDSASSVPVATFAKASAEPTAAANPVTTYYQGVLAMRQGKSEAAAAAWDKASAHLATPWLVENLTNLRRGRATALAQAGDWPAVIDLFQQTREESATGEVDTVFGEIAGHAYFQLGFTAGQAGDWPKAYRSFKAANELIKNRRLSQNLALAAEACDEWNTAADAWREMVRRRPRKADHPDYLSDAQVAAIWNRVTDCYIEAENPEEAISALKNALKYDEQNVKLRLKLADLLHSEDRGDAAENELNRILEIDPNHVPALTRLGTLYTGQWGRDPMPIWKRVLALQPKNEDARTALALLYVEQADGGGMDSPFAALAPNRRGKKTPVQILQEGLAQVPNHPILLVELARHTYTKEKEKPVARDYLMQAARAAPRDVRMMGAILHELLHADGGEQVRELTPQVRQIGGLRPSFWVNQGEQVLHCKLGADWAQFFWEQATATAQPMRGEDSPAAILLHIYDTADDHGEAALAERYANQLRKEHPKSGAVEYIDAVKLWRKDAQKTAPIVRLLEKAKSIAQKAGEPEIASIAEEFEMGVKYPQRGSLFDSGNPFLALMRGFDGDDDLDDDDLDDDDLDDDDLDDDDLDIDKDDLFNAFRRIFR